MCGRFKINIILVKKIKHAFLVNMNCVSRLMGLLFRLWRNVISKPRIKKPTHNRLVEISALNKSKLAEGASLKAASPTAGFSSSHLRLQLDSESAPAWNI